MSVPELLLFGFFLLLKLKTVDANVVASRVPFDHNEAFLHSTGVTTILVQQNAKSSYLWV